MASDPARSAADPSREARSASLPQDWFVEMAERVPELVIVASADGKASYINPAGRRLLGVPDNDPALLRIHDLHPAAELEHLVDEAIPTALRDGTWTGRTALLTRAGAQVPIVLTLNAHRDADGRLVAISLIGRDLSHLDDEVRERRVAEGLFRSITENSADMVLVLDEYGQTRYTNPTIQAVLGYTPEEALAMDNWSLVHPDDIDAARTALEQLLQRPNETVELALRIRHADGHDVPLELHAKARLNDPDMNGIVIYARDLTRRVVREDLMRDRLVEMRDEQRERTRHMDQIAHDMKQPLSPIMLQLHLLEHLHRDGDAKTRRAIEVIGENTKRLERFIDDLRDAAKIERGALDLHLEPIDLGTRVASVVKSLQPEATGRKVRLDRVCFSTFPVHGDADRIDQVLFNLVRNAFKFTPEGGLIRITVRRDGDAAKCIVSDTGRGIASDHLERIFAPFVQAPDDGVASEKGTGLGLTICRGIIERHGGHIWAESEGHGRGARFVFTVPLLQEAAEQD